MKFKESKVERINDVTHDKKVSNPYHTCGVIGIGVGLFNTIDSTVVGINNSEICNIDDLGRLIEELQMLKDSIEEETGLEL